MLASGAQMDQKIVCYLFAGPFKVDGLHNSFDVLVCRGHVPKANAFQHISVFVRHKAPKRGGHERRVNRGKVLVEGLVDGFYYIKPFIEWVCGSVGCKLLNKARSIVLTVKIY